MKLYRTTARTPNPNWHIYDDCKIGSTLKQRETKNVNLAALLKPELCNGCRKRLAEDEARERRKHLKSY